MSYKIRKHIKQSQKRFHQKNNINNSDNFSTTKKSGKKSNSDSSIPKDFGEYTDYEELE
ncbi:MAG: hypothetical protein ACOX4D_03180 [Bacteroidales bacterium]